MFTATCPAVRSLHLANPANGYGTFVSRLLIKVRLVNDCLQDVVTRRLCKEDDYSKEFQSHINILHKGMKEKDGAFNVMSIKVLTR
jgi:hypothetical protein